jgi:hypothetical protein
MKRCLSVLASTASCEEVETKYGEKNRVAGFMNASTKILYCVQGSQGSLFIKPNKHG